MDRKRGITKALVDLIDLIATCIETGEAGHTWWRLGQAQVLPTTLIIALVLPCISISVIYHDHILTIAGTLTSEAPAYRPSVNVGATPVLLCNDTQ